MTTFSIPVPRLSFLSELFNVMISAILHQRVHGGIHISLPSLQHVVQNTDIDDALVEDEIVVGFVSGLCVREEQEFFLVSSHGTWHSIGKHECDEWLFHTLWDLVLIRQKEVLVVNVDGEEQSLGFHDSDMVGINPIGIMFGVRDGETFQITDDGKEVPSRIEY